MKRKKLHVMNIKDEAALSREEMKQIMAGSSGGDQCDCKYKCCVSGYPNQCTSCVEGGDNPTCPGDSYLVECTTIPCRRCY